MTNKKNCKKRTVALIARFFYVFHADYLNLKKMVTISTVGLIGSHAAGLLQISNHRDLVEEFFEIYESAVGEIKGAFLQSLSKMISVR